MSMEIFYTIAQVTSDGLKLPNWWWWIIIGLVLMLGEMVIPGFFIFPFGIGAILTAFIAWLPLPGWVDLVAFVVFSILATLFLRPLLLKIGSGHGQHVKTGADALVNQEGYVIQEIDGSKTPGLVKVDGQDFTAITDNGIKIAKDARVFVREVRSTKLFVEEL